jgi:ArsR family transcriptional regulator
MSNPKSERSVDKNLEARAELFKALGHPVRLLILNLLQMKPRHGEELATILNLKPATISHHLSKLTEVGLVESEKDQYYQTYSILSEPLTRTIAEVVHLPQPGLRAEVEEDAYRNKVLNTFLKHGRLIQIPTQIKKQRIILEKIVEEFEPDHSYPEREVNHILLDFHEDVATLRRSMISFKLMEREAGIYQRVITKPKNQDSV